MESRTFAIGDIHGCYDELMALYNGLKKYAKFSPGKDTLVFLGDYIDRGDKSKEVVDQLIKWHKKYKHWVFLYGNHEDIFRDWLRGAPRYGTSNWFANGGRTTFESYGGHYGREVNGVWEAPKSPEFPQKHLDFLFKETVYMHEDDKHVFVHAGLVPDKPLSEQLNYPDTLTWARYEFINSPCDWGKYVIFGHTPNGYYVGMPTIMDNKCGIDGAVCPPSSLNLLAIELPSRKIYGLQKRDHKIFTTSLDSNHQYQIEYLI